MTNEEALEILDTIPTIGEQVDALELAIKALEQQPCEDCISRETVINELDNLCDCLCEYSKKQRATMCDACKLGSVFDKVNELPPVTPQPTRWIPCSERMPEVTDHYLIQYSRHICRDEMAVAFYSVEEAECDENYTWEFKPFADCKEVIAWMPLPELYRESEDK